MHAPFLYIQNAKLQLIHSDPQRSYKCCGIKMTKDTL